MKVVKNDTPVSNKLPTYNDLNQAGLVAFPHQEEFTRTIWSDGYQFVLKKGDHLYRHELLHRKITPTPYKFFDAPNSSLAEIKEPWDVKTWGEGCAYVWYADWYLPTPDDFSQQDWDNLVLSNSLPSPYGTKTIKKGSDMFSVPKDVSVVDLR